MILIFMAIVACREDFFFSILSFLDRDMADESGVYANLKSRRSYSLKYTIMFVVLMLCCLTYVTLLHYDHGATILVCIYTKLTLGAMRMAAYCPVHGY